MSPNNTTEMQDIQEIVDDLIRELLNFNETGNGAVDSSDISANITTGSEFCLQFTDTFTAPTFEVLIVVQVGLFFIVCLTKIRIAV